MYCVKYIFVFSEHKTDMGNRLSKLQHLESAAKAQCMLQLDKSSVANAKVWSQDRPEWDISS